jgi:hypothetical protein
LVRSNDPRVEHEFPAHERVLGGGVDVRELGADRLAARA